MVDNIGFDRDRYPLNASSGPIGHQVIINSELIINLFNILPTKLKYVFRVKAYDYDGGYNTKERLKLDLNIY